jgi:hypothetical protein
MIASAEARDIIAGASGARCANDGAVRVFAVDARSTQKVELRFHPVWSISPWDVELPAECVAQGRRLVRDACTVGAHHWVLQDPLCRVEGEISAGSDQVKASKLEGMGYHDYSYGSGPIGLDARGRVLGDDRFVAFRMRKGIVEGTREGITVHRDIEWPGTLGLGSMEVAGVLRMNGPERLASSHHGTHEAYVGEYEGKRAIGFGETFGGSFGRVTIR